MENKTEENTLLINELNNLRVEKKTLTEIKNQLECQLNLFMKKNNNLEESLKLVQKQLKLKIEETLGNLDEARTQIKDIANKYSQFLKG